MEDYKKLYYEQPELWNGETPDENSPVGERMEETRNAIPEGIESVLEVGCGNGVFINSLRGKYKRLVGLDHSQEALKHVQVEAIKSGVDNLPLADNSFDLVVCLEVLEHLSQDVFAKALAELQRVSKKYIIITVPNNENLDLSLVRCPMCHCQFHPIFHLRGFNQDSLKQLFSKFTPVLIKEIGPLAINLPGKGSFVDKFFLGSYQVLRIFLKEPNPSSAICPQCGYQPPQGNDAPKKVAKSSNLRSKIFKLLKSAAKVKKTKRSWLLTLYKKNEL